MGIFGGLTSSRCLTFTHCPICWISLTVCTVFSKIDLRKGYWQVPVRMEDRKKTAVITPFGLFQFKRMPFGLRNAGRSFQRMMDRVLAGLPFTYCYLDDLRVASPDLEAHKKHLRLVF